MGVEPAELSAQEIETISALSKAAASGDWSTEVTDGIKALARAAAREEVASLAGLVLRRTQVQDLTRVPEHNIAEEVVNSKLASIFGEVLSDFSGHTGSGDIPEASDK